MSKRERECVYVCVCCVCVCVCARARVRACVCVCVQEAANTAGYFPALSEGRQRPGVAPGVLYPLCPDDMRV